VADMPMLQCPWCGVDLIAPHGRGRHDNDGNIIEHRTNCRCRWCDWMWFDDAVAVTCACGAVVRVDCDDGSAYAKLVTDHGCKRSFDA
jgi:hypothetical protein